MTIIMPITSKTNSKQNKKTDTKATKKDIQTTKNQSQKKGIIKRRTSDLTLSKASATAIASKANHAKNNAITKNFTSTNIRNLDSSKKIPIWVWIFFWCSLLLFCCSIYQAIIRPQLEVEIMNVAKEGNVGDNENDVNNTNPESNESLDTKNWTETVNLGITNEVTDVIQLFFSHISNRDFDQSFDLMIPVLRKSSEIREHFSAFRMIPFLEWIEWWALSPYNFQYISTSTYGRDRYSFDLSYTLSSTHETYDETREFVVDTKWDDPKITSVVCVTPKCSYHPIFRPENFGLMK